MRPVAAGLQWRVREGGRHGTGALGVYWDLDKGLPCRFPPVVQEAPLAWWTPRQGYSCNTWTGLSAMLHSTHTWDCMSPMVGVATGE